MYTSVNYLKKTLLTVVSLSKSISQLKISVVFNDVLAEYVFCRNPSHFSWFGFEPASAVSADLSHETKFSTLPGKLRAKPFPMSCMQDHTVRSQSHTHLSLCACNRKDLLYGQNLLTINWSLLASAFLAKLFP